MTRFRAGLAGVLMAILPGTAAAQAPNRPFGTLRQQAERQQRWLEQRLKTVLPAVMRKHGVDMWVVPMREYNEDPLFTSLVSPTTFAARRRTIYVFFDTGSEVERIALGGSSQGGVYAPVFASKSVGGRNAELWGDQQWSALKAVVEKRDPKRIAIDKSRISAFADGLSSGEYEGMSEALGPAWTTRFTPAEDMAVELIATRLADEEVFYAKLTAHVWSMIDEMFSSRTVKPGVTRTSDLVWWWRQRLGDLGLGTWFHPSISVQRKGVPPDSLGDDPVIEQGDLLWCDVGITALRLNTDTQHDAYVLRRGETDAPAGLRQALANSNRLQDILFEEVRPGRTGNEILAASLAKMRAAGLDGTLYTHPIGMHGHGAGPLIGLWDYQDGVPGRGDHRVVPSMWFSSELQVTTPVPEWRGQRVQMRQEEDFFVGADGKPRWALKRQTRLHLVR